MKPTDTGYSYDELEGFEPLKLVRPRHASNEVWMSVKENIVSFSAAARTVLCARKYIQVMISKDRKRILMISSPDEGQNTLKVTKTGDCSSIALRQFLEKELRYDLSDHRMHIKGELCRSKKNAVIFDLASVTTRRSGKAEK